MKLALAGRDAGRVLAFRGSLLREAQSRGHQVMVVTGPASRADQDRLAAAGVRCIPVPLDAGGMHPLRDLRFQRAVREVLQHERPDALLAYNPKPLAFATVAARKAGVPRVVGMVTGLGHGFVGGGLRERLVRWAKCRLYRRAFDACDTILLQNQDDRRDLERHGALTLSHAARVRMVAGSGVDLERFAVRPLPQGAHFLMIARPLAEKGLPEYLEAARLVSGQLAGASFRWMGAMDDPNPSALPAARLARLLADGPVQHLPETDDVRSAIESCSVFVLPSHREGTSKVMLEAMAMGRPVITTDAPGCGEVPGTAGARIVATHDTLALAEAMIEIGSDATLRAQLGRGAQARARERFDHRSVDATVLSALGL